MLVLTVVGSSGIRRWLVASEVMVESDGIWWKPFGYYAEEWRTIRGEDEVWLSIGDEKPGRIWPKGGR